MKDRQDICRKLEIYSPDELFVNHEGDVCAMSLLGGCGDPDCCNGPVECVVFYKDEYSNEDWQYILSLLEEEKGE